VVSGGRGQKKKGVTAPCKACRRRVPPEFLDRSYLCDRCRGDAAAVWLAVNEVKRR
jgi:hypothetical protein